jgi:hypothetical protein
MTTPNGAPVRESDYKSTPVIPGRAIGAGATFHASFVATSQMLSMPLNPLE